MSKISEKSWNVLNFLQNHPDENYTSNDVAEALNMSRKSVDCIFTSFQRAGKEWGYREESTVVVDGETKKVKFFRLTEAGMNFVPSDD